MDLSAALKAFAAVFPAELPDKTMVATIVLVARYQRPLAVWCGAAAAFAVHVAVAVAAGSLLTLLPEDVVTVTIAGLFTVGAVLLWRSASAQAREAQTEMEEAEGSGAEPGRSSDPGNPPARAAIGAFAVIAVAEWGDLTQLATAGIAGSTGAPVAVAVGALLALWSVSALGATIGRGLVARLPLAKLQRGAAVVFAALAVVSLLGLV